MTDRTDPRPYGRLRRFLYGTPAQPTGYGWRPRPPTVYDGVAADLGFDPLMERDNRQADEPAAAGPATTAPPSGDTYVPTAAT